ncbi:proteoglycan 4-like [Pyrus ussuriensis x Pyrus communis]|uniref:Proteoglycan 4-like n=1 Tax=Pyrus ussuriensis x Pyrus communis TaxID=2448454 RepID=A0A5N5H0M6_9ROSA|nr:proteoglycan 4-like [Pyrus ussuriensis x Pyrus communis]
MASKKQTHSLRFRLPWRSRGSKVEPDPRPVAKTQNPAQTSTSAPVERPPFRPAGKAPVKASPSQAQAPLKIEPPPPSPSRSATESQKSSSATTQTRVEVDSSPSSTSRAATESQQTSSATAQTGVESFRSSPSHTASQLQGASQESPPAQLQPHTQENSPLPSLSAESPSPATQPEPKEPYAEISTSETIPKAQNKTPTAEQTHVASTVAVETVASPEKADPDTVGGDQKHHAESETESKEHEEREKVLQAVIKEERKRHKKQETFDRNETLGSTTSSSKPTQTPKDRSTSRVSNQKMVSLTAEQAPLHKEIKEAALEMSKLATEDQMLEKPVSIVTLSGENRGATMHNSSEPENGEEFMPIHRSYKTNPDDSLEATTDEEESSEGENFDQTSKDHQRIAYTNSNVQSINNSIVFNTSVAERNPGVQSVFSQKPAEPSSQTSTVRRRCPLGFFMEPSDSDSGNPDKPRHHGCRYSYSIGIFY